MNFKKTVTLWLILALVTAVFAGCAAPAAEVPAAEAPATEAPATQAPAAGDEDILIGFAQTKMNHPYRVMGVKEMEEAVNALGRGWKFIYTDAEDSTEKQTSDVEDLIVQGCDVIIMAPHTPDALVPAAQAVQAAGIPLILLDRMINSEDYDVFIGGDNWKIGVLAGELVVKAAEGKDVKVAILNITMGSSAQIDRRGGFLEAIEGHDNIQVVGDLDTAASRENAMKATEDLLIAHPDLFAIWGQNDSQAIAAMRACQAAGRNDVITIGADGTIEAFDLIKSGEMTASILYPTGGKDAVEVARKIIDGEPYEREYVLEVPCVTAENIDEWYDKGLPSN